MLERVLGEKDDAHYREGQVAMVEAVAQAIEDRAHLMVEAGTGTGKSLAYLIPPLVAGKRVVIATATKNLQNQLSDSELPFLAETMGRSVTWAVLKGRQSYACMAKLVERFGEDLAGEGLLFPGDDVEALVDVVGWARTHPTGDRDDLDDEVEDKVWRSISVSGMECPGKTRCPQGGACFAEKASEQAEFADVIITNHHLYGLHLTSGGRILPAHDLVIFDEAHRLESAFSSAFGVDLGGGRLHSLANNANRLIDPAKRDNDPVGGLHGAADDLDSVVKDLQSARLRPGDGLVGTALRGARRQVDLVSKSLIKPDELDDDAGAVARVKNQAGHVIGDIDLGFNLPADYVAWAEPWRGVVRVSPVEVSRPLAEHLLTQMPVVLTSATLSIGGRFEPLAERLGFLAEPLEDDPFAEEIEEPIERTYRALSVGTSFDFQRQGLLYVAAHLPDPRHENYPIVAADEVETLVESAGGRALVLTTSFANMRTFAAKLGSDRDYKVLVQGELPKKQLLAEFADDETSVLVATMGFWEGIDIPGRALSLLVIDKIPFARPDDPLNQARRDAVEARGASAFDRVDLPNAAMLMAQGAGRLIRNETDKGMVAILDRRLISMRCTPSGIRIIRTMPKFLRTTDRHRADSPSSTTFSGRRCPLPAARCPLPAARCPSNLTLLPAAPHRGGDFLFLPPLGGVAPLGVEGGGVAPSGSGCVQGVEDFDTVG